MTPVIANSLSSTGRSDDKLLRWLPNAKRGLRLPDREKRGRRARF